MKKKLAILNTGFMAVYFDDLKETCAEKGIELAVFENYEEYSSHLEEFDYFLTDCKPEYTASCNIFHAHTLLQRAKAHKFFIAGWIFYLGHLSRIKKLTKKYKQLTKLICVSNVLKKDFVENYGISPDKIIVAYAGFIPQRDNDNKSFRPFNKERKFIIGMDARGFVNKGGYDLLSALRLIRKRNPQSRICAKIIYPKYKKNWLLKLYIKFFRLSNIVEFLDYQEDMTKFYNTLDCFISASCLETFGRVVLEAMYEKIPVIIGSNIGANDVVKNGVHGFSFDVSKQKVKNLADRIEYVYQNHANLESVVEEGYKLSKEFTWKNFTQMLLDGLYGSD